MKKHILSALFLLIVLVACSDDDDFSSDQNLRLGFSADSIAFDTVFTTIGSATKQFKIHNRNNKSLVIESAELVNAAKSGFRMNIDGVKGTRITNLEVLKNDSLFGFVEVTVNPLDENSPVLIKDSIRFVTNGNVQYVHLEAVGQDVYIWKNRSVTKDSIITNTKPLLVYDSLVVKKGAKATIGEGVTLYMKAEASIQVHGTLLVQGTIENPVAIRGSRFGNIEGKIPYDNVPGQWDGIYFFPESFGNRLENVHIRNANRSMTFYPSVADMQKAVIYNTIVHNSYDYGILASNCRIDFTNGLFSNARGAVVELQGGEYNFWHCTIANYFSWASRGKESMVLAHSGTNLLDCKVTNTIIYGSLSRELLIDKAIQGDYSFINCLIRGNEQAGGNFTDIIWNTAPLFLNLNKDKDYSYNFRLQENSPAIAAGNQYYSQSVPYDIDGYPRLTDGSSNIGCYEH
ncbi:hypothetical protein [Dysgonomonas sp. 511]|uniref:hypothetical protein n=1 Tax=Dysgonomonas sp. 511 TaxID=2302930 RepID=UPI0034CE7FA9